MALSLHCPEKSVWILVSGKNKASVGKPARRRHITVELTIPWHEDLGTDHEWTVSKAVFYGNLFPSPPEAYIAAGSNYAQALCQASTALNEIVMTENLMPHSCSVEMVMMFTNFAAKVHECPITLACSASAIDWSRLLVNERNKYMLPAMSPSSQEGMATKCLSPGTNGRTWGYPITTWFSKGWDSTPIMSQSSEMPICERDDFVEFVANTCLQVKIDCACCTHCRNIKPYNCKKL